MYIKEIHINAFGPIVDTHIEASRGLNIIEGANESGKSAVATFIRFVLYGLPARGGAGVSERQRYISWKKGVASGYLVVVAESEGEKRELRIERTLASFTSSDGKPRFSEDVKLLDNITNMPVKFSLSPGEFLFGVGESVFTNSAYTSQSRELCPDSGALRESLENMISAADENISVRRAADALERARVKLLHKNQAGGEIFELERQISELEDTCARSAEGSARLIRAEVSLTDTKEKLEKAVELHDTLEKNYAALRSIDDAVRLRRAGELESKLTELEAAASEHLTHDPGESFADELREATRDIQKYNDMREALTKKRDAIGEKVDSSIEEDVELVYSLMQRSKVFFLLTIAFFGLGVAGFVAGFFFKVLPVMAISALLLAAGIVSVLTFFSAKRNAYEILDEWGVESEQELEELTEGTEEERRELEELRANLDSAASSSMRAEDTLDTLAARIGKEEETRGKLPHELALFLGEYYAKYTARARALEAQRLQLEGQLTELRAATSAADTPEKRASLLTLLESETGKRAAMMTEEERSKIRRDIGFYKNKIESLRIKELELERECAALRAENPSPAGDVERLADMKKRLAAMKRAHSAYVLALETLGSAAEGVRSSVVPRLVAGASELLSRVTDGKYKKLSLSSNLDMAVSIEGIGTKALDFLSAGTKDAVYIALRLSFVKALYEKDSLPPVIFDESLAYLDEDRVAAALKMLSSAGELQTFVFTCRTLEGRVAHNGRVTRLLPPAGCLE